MIAFSLFKSIPDLCIPSDQHPGKVLNQLQMYFIELKNTKFKLPTKTQIMLHLVKLPPNMEVVAQKVATDGITDTTTFKSIQKLAILFYEQHTIWCGQALQSTYKLSAVKPKPANLSFTSQQQQHIPHKGKQKESKQSRSNSKSSRQQNTNRNYKKEHTCGTCGKKAKQEQKGQGNQMLASPITSNEAFSGFASIIKLTNSLQFTDSTLDILEDPWKLVQTATAPSFRSLIFKETPCTILLIEWMGIEVTPQVVWILDPISAKVSQTNTHIHTLHNHFTVPSIQSAV